MMSGGVDSLWRYPVKSMGGEQLAAVALTARGLTGDRAYALIDRVTGKVASAKHPRLWGQLLACRASATALSAPDAAGVPVQITLPDGRTVVAGHAEADAALSALLGRDVAVADAAPSGAEIERYWPDIDGLAVRDAVTSGAIGFGAPPGTFFDYAPVHILTTATLDRLRALYPTGQVDVRRFRPNLVVALVGGAEGFVENTWVGRTVLIGDSLRLRVTDPAPRCVVPTLPQADVPRDMGILRAVVAHNRPPIPALGGARQPSLGVYAVVEQGGTMRHGDPDTRGAWRLDRDWASGPRPGQRAGTTPCTLSRVVRRATVRGRRTTGRRAVAGVTARATSTAGARHSGEPSYPTIL